MLDNLLTRILTPLLDKLGTGWKTSLGLLCMATISILNTMGKISEAQTVTYGGMATVLFGIGVFHKTTTDVPPK